MTCDFRNKGVSAADLLRERRDLLCLCGRFSHTLFALAAPRGSIGDPQSLVNLDGEAALEVVSRILVPRLQQPQAALLNALHTKHGVQGKDIS